METLSGRNCTIRLPTITAISDPGILFKSIGEMIRIARLTIPTIKASVFIVEIFSANALNFSVVSIGFTPSG